MVDLGVLLTFPVESIAIRVVLASAVGVLLVRALLRVGLRSPSVRVATALAPAGALLLVLLAARGQFELPTLMLPADAVDALPVPVRDGYVHFAPMAVPLLLGTWALVAGTRLARRAHTTVRGRRAAWAALAEGLPVPDRVARTATTIAAELRVPAPRIAVVPSCTGGASVVGTRRPVLVLGVDLLEQLDDEELEGVLAHELAHVRRRDNLVALLLGAVRDLAFFVPGGGWAVRQLHVERERAADQVAATTTGRPGALASGLLKVLERGTLAHPCAALAPSSSLVDRIEALVEDQPPIGRLRRTGEVVAVVGVTATAVVLALVLPGVLAGAERERDAVALVWSPAAADAGAVGEARAFDVYRRTRLEVTGPAVSASPAAADEGAVVDRRGTLRTCATDPGSCPGADRDVGLGIVPRPTITVDTELTRRWTVGNEVFGSDAAGGLVPQVYFLQRVR
ncbi:M56 family metallopeptidase [Nitriliruptoraceae bacterium ZYF776]|nr:M56 family metallopeptidase [Profundirhabdus halotolerans]